VRLPLTDGADRPTVAETAKLDRHLARRHLAAELLAQAVDELFQELAVVGGSGAPDVGRGWPARRSLEETEF